MAESSTVEKVLGFSPTEFADAVFKFVDDYLSDGVNEIEKQMKEASKRRKTAIDESALHESCNEFSELLRSTFYKNMDRFELYANRNIFIPPSARLAAKKETQISRQLDAVTQETNALRKQYLELRRKSLQLAQDMQAAKAAADAMRQAQYDVRVAAQAGRLPGNQSLRDHMKQLVSAKRKLEEQIATAEELVERMGGPVDASAASSGRREGEAAAGIEAPQSASEIAEVTKRMRERSGKTRK